MIKIQEEYLHELKKLRLAIQNAGLDTVCFSEFEQKVETLELLLPVVGEFSAGKSTLLNSFIDSEVFKLPTDMTPKTALATELRYDQNERIEGMSSDGVVSDTFDISSIGSIDPNKYAFLRVYLNNQNIKSIEPFVLVDMPGFESAHDSHNVAIKSYLTKGAYFMFLVSATDGTLKANVSKHMGIVKDYGSDFFVIISKSNLRRLQIDAIVDEVSQCLEEQFAEPFDPIPVEMDGKAAVLKIINSINPDLLFANKIRYDFQNFIEDLRMSVESSIKGFNNSTFDNDKIIESCKSALQSIMDEERNLKQLAESNQIFNHVPQIVDAVCSDVEANADNLAHIVVNSGNDVLSVELNEVISSSLTINLNTTLDKISNEITSKMNNQLNLFGSGTQAFDMGFVQKISSNVSVLVNKTVQEVSVNNVANFQQLMNHPKVQEAVNHMPPFLQVVFGILPSILNAISERKHKENMRKIAINDAKNQIATIVIPKLRRELSNSIPSIFKAYVNGLIERISQSYSEKIKLQNVAIEKAEAEKKKNSDQIAKQMANLTSAQNAVSSVIDKYFV